VLNYPNALREPIIETLHGQSVADPYRWLERGDDPETQRWTREQRALLEARATTWIGREHWRRRVGELLAGGGISVPTWCGERQFFMRRNPDQQHAVLLTIDADGSERVLIDPMDLDPNGLTTLDAWQPSPNGELLAYQLSEGGTEESTIRVMLVADCSPIDGPIDRVRYSPIAWLPDNSGYYYVRKPHPSLVPADEAQYHRRVLLHRLGTNPDTDDVEIFGAGQVITNYYGVDISRDGRWLQISASEGTAPRNDLWWADLQASSPEAPALIPIQQDVDAQTWIHAGRDGRAYVFTDLDAPRGRILVAPVEDPRPEHWTELVAEHPESVLDRFVLLEHGLEAPELCIAWSTHTVASITAHDAATGTPKRTLQLPGFGTISGLGERHEGGHEFWYSYTDHTTLGSVYRYDAAADAHSLWATPPGSVEVPQVHTHHVTYRSPDGTEVRMFVIAPTAEPDRPRPTILYGYGGFGISLEPAYSASKLAWVEAGGVYAIANIRGGGEEGEEWHRDGMLANKQHCFDDFIAAAEWLIAQGWTSPEHCSISGGSNGGLLVGAVMTQRPELFSAVVCEAALLDMIRYEQFGLGATWNVEYGSAAQAESFAWLHSYSPYHHVVEGTDYPATLITVFDSDSRVDPMHGRKMAAALQHAQSGDRDILIRAEENVGHGARSLDRSIELLADVLSFTARWTGLEVEGA
jgi:prolyl oligopeptidase